MTWHKPSETLSNAHKLIESLQRQILKMQTKIISTDAKVEALKARLDFWATSVTRRSQ